MKITIKNEEYKLLHNIPKGTRLMYEDELCIKTENKMLVGIYTGNVYLIPSAKKIIVDIKRDILSLENLSMGDFFIYKGQLYLLVDTDYPNEVFNFNTLQVEYLYDDEMVERVLHKNIQIKVK